MGWARSQLNKLIGVTAYGITYAVLAMTSPEWWKAFFRGFVEAYRNDRDGK
jgi:hypothetical protein